MTKVFVYGTLKRGWGNHRILEESNLLGECVTHPNFTMVHLGGFPGVLMGGETAISGEVYEVDELTMNRLDGLEGYPSFYNRLEIPTDYGMAWMYYLSDRYSTHPVIEDGVWK
jgi:gamma-glutamylcyclotransferase (GGCT)/AIG2-like uncharacterized protein YtfP